MTANSQAAVWRVLAVSVSRAESGGPSGRAQTPGCQCAAQDRSRPSLEQVGEAEEEFIEYSAAEQAMRRWLYQQGLLCARRPVLVLTLCLLCVGACALGMVRLRVMTDPQELWVGRGSQAAQEKADYEVGGPPLVSQGW